MARQGGGGVRRCALEARRPPGPRPRRCPATWPRRPSWSCWPGPTTRPGRPGPPSPRSQAGYGDSRRRILVASSEGRLAEDDQVRTRFNVVAWPPGTPACRPDSRASPGPRASRSSTAADVDEVARTAAQRALTKLSARPAPSGELPVVLAGGQRRHPLPRGLRPRAGGRPHRQGRLGLRGPDRPAGGQPAGHPGRRRHGGRRVGELRHRRRGPAGRPQRPDRPRGADRLPVGLAAGP